jgi:glycosyl transferase family 2
LGSSHGRNISFHGHHQIATLIKACQRDARTFKGTAGSQRRCSHVSLARERIIGGSKELELARAFSPMNADDDVTRRLSTQVSARGETVVAIPVRNEFERIGSCLTALSEQTMVPDIVVLLLNNCDDGTADVARRLIGSLPFPLDIDSVTLPPCHANAGHARRVAMQRAARHAGSDGTLLTTDADALVATDWVARNVAAISAGADGVCGRILVDPMEALAIPQNLHNDDARECELLDLLDEIAFTLDPDPHDPRPRHWQASGASLAVSAGSFRHVGGVPRVASGEDRALIDALVAVDARVRHDREIVVAVSARLDGRAPGGMADTIRRRVVSQDEYCDELVEPPADTFRRFDFRRRTRKAWQMPRAVDARIELAADLRLAPKRLNEILSGRYFGAAWARIQRASPLLLRRRIRFADLPRHIELARQFLEVRQSDLAPIDLFGVNGY